jgi:hypothetical protein
LGVEVGRSAVEDAGSFAGTVEEEKGGDGGDVAEGQAGGRIRDGPVEIGAEGADGGADLVFGGFDGQGKDGEVVAVLALEFAEPFEGGAAGRAPGGPELDENDATGEILAIEELAGEIGEFEVGQGRDFLRSTGAVGMLAGDYVFSSGEDEVDHASEIGFEFFLAGRAAPGSVAAGAFDFAEVTEFTGGGNQDIVHEDGRIALHTEFFGELGGAEVFGDEGDLARVFGGDFLNQQTCWVGDISSVGPADESEVDGFAGGQLERRGGLFCREIGGEDLIEDDAGAAPFVGAGSGTIGVYGLRCRALEEKLGEGIVLFGGGKLFLRSSEVGFQCGLLGGIEGKGFQHAVVARSFEILIESAGIEFLCVELFGELERGIQGDESGMEIDGTGRLERGIRSFLEFL